jgi:hypothetical protein
MRFDLATGKMVDGDSDPAAVNLPLSKRLRDSDIDRWKREQAKADQATLKAEREQFKAQRAEAKALLAEHGEDLAHFAFVHCFLPEQAEPTIPKWRKQLKSDAWFQPDVVIAIAKIMKAKQEGRL